MTSWVALTLTLVLAGQGHGLTLEMAWLAPQSEYLSMKAGSSLGGLALGVNTVEGDTGLLGSNNFNVVWEDSDCNSKDAVIAMYNILINQSLTLDVIIGPPCSDSMGPVGELAAYRDTPIFGWLSDSPSFSDKSKYSTLVRVLPPINAIGQGLMQVLDFMEWYRIFLISSEGYPYADLGQSIFNEVSGTNYTLARWQQDVDLEATDDTINDIYSNVKKEARIVIMAVPRSELRTWMLQASSQGMTGGGYVFIFLSNEVPTKDLFDELRDRSFWERGDGRDGSAESAYKNLLFLTTQAQNLDSADTYFADANDAGSSAAWSSKFPGVTPQNGDVYSPYLHDAVLLYATLAQEAADNLEDYKQGQVLLTRAKSRYFNGSEWATGEIFLDANGDRDPDFWLLDMAENGTFTTIGLRTVHKRTPPYEKSVEIVDDIIWGDGSRGFENRPPEVPGCGFDGSKCTDMIPFIVPPVVIGVLIIIGIIAFFLIRRWQFEQSLKDMVWKVNYGDLERSPKHKGLEGSAFLRLSRASSLRGSHHSKRSHLANGLPALNGHGPAGSHARLSKAETVSMASADEAGQVFIDTANYKGGVVAVKPLRRDRVKVDRDFLVEMRKMVDMKHDKLVAFVGASIDPPHICEVWEYCPKGSLQDVIWNDNIKLDDMFKFSMSADIFRGLKHLHDSSFKFHGRLKSSNCVVDGRWVCKLADYGAFQLRDGIVQDPDLSEHKKYSRLFWTAPELLREATSRGPGVMGMSQEADVYAGAVILKEIFSRDGPYTEYDEMSPAEIIEQVEKVPRSSDSAFRPSLSEANAPGRLLDIIRSGWQERPQDRPTASHVLKDIQKANPSKSSNVVDGMIRMMERYTNNLEEMVQERTQEVDEEKRKSEMLLYQMLPRSVGEELKKGKSVEPEVFKAVSIYFSDIVSFTKLSAASTPLQVVNLLNGLYTGFDSAIAEHDVYKVETIGDAYMLVSGLPIRNGDNHAVEITNCAMDLLSIVVGYKVAHMPDDYQLKIRIGLHTGPVVAGVVGLTMPRYCLFGDTVNYGSKMESGGAPMRIHMSQATYNILSKFSGYNLAERTQIDPKTNQKLITYFLVSKENFDKPFPDFDALCVGEDLQLRKLGYSKGKEFRSLGSTRPSLESGIYDMDSLDNSRKPSMNEDVSKLDHISEQDSSRDGSGHLQNDGETATPAELESRLTKETTRADIKLQIKDTDVGSKSSQSSLKSEPKKKTSSASHQKEDVPSSQRDVKIKEPAVEEHPIDQPGTQKTNRDKDVQQEKQQENTEQKEETIEIKEEMTEQMEETTEQKEETTEQKEETTEQKEDTLREESNNKNAQLPEDSSETVADKPQEEDTTTDQQESQESPEPKPHTILQKTDKKKRGGRKRMKKPQIPEISVDKTETDV